MKTAAILHTTRCSVSGCLADAVITYPCPGDSPPKGYCRNHLSNFGIETATKRFEQQLLDTVTDYLARK